MRQLIESIIDVGSGLLIATLLQLYVFPFFGMYPTVWESFNIAVIFMCVSIFRSWLWRLVFVRFKNEKKEIKDTTQAEWAKGYREWKRHNLYHRFVATGVVSPDVKVKELKKLLRRQNGIWGHVKEIVRRRYKEVK